MACSNPAGGCTTPSTDRSPTSCCTGTSIGFRARFFQTPRRGVSADPVALSILDRGEGVGSDKRSICTQSACNQATRRDTPRVPITRSTYWVLRRGSQKVFHPNFNSNSPFHLFPQAHAQLRPAPGGRRDQGQRAVSDLMRSDARERLQGEGDWDGQ